MNLHPVDKFDQAPAQVVQGGHEKGPVTDAKSSTQRVREFRERQRELGSRPSGMVLSANAQLAIEVIRQVRRTPYKVRIIEESLVREAQRLCPCDERAQELVDKGLLSADVAKAWKKVRAEVEQSQMAETKDAAAPQAPAALTKERRKPGDVRAEVGPNRRDLRLVKGKKTRSILG